MTLSEVPVFVLSVKTFVDRHQSIRAQADRFGFKPEWVFDFDVGDLTEGDHQRFADDASLPNPTKSLVLKHFRAMEAIVERKLPYALILEDDAIFFDDVAERIKIVTENLEQLPPSWLIFLGGADNKIDQRFLDKDKNVFIEAPITTTEAYLTDYESCKRRIEWVAQNGIELPSDHQLQKMDPLLSIAQFKLANPMCTQGSISGLFDTELDSSRQRHGKMFIKLRYAYNRFRRQTLPRFVSSLRIFR